MTDEQTTTLDRSEDFDTSTSGSWRDRARSMRLGYEARADRVESRYLSVLRHTLLIIASALLIGALVLAIVGAIKQVGSSEVEPEPVTIVPADIAPDTPIEAAKSGDPVVREEPFRLSEALRKRTLSTYRQYFAPFERKGEAASADAVLQEVWPEERRKAFDGLPSTGLMGPDGKLFANGEAIALHAVSVSGDATKEAGFKQSLQAYKGAKKVRVCRDVTRERPRTVDGWDSYSTDCPGWYYSPIGCPATRTVQEPYTVKVCEMQFPADISAPHEAMGESIQQFLKTAETRADQARFDAQDREAAINSRKVSGRGNLFDGGRLFLGFLGLMFLYLLVVMERHHRALRHLLPRDAS